MENNRNDVAYFNEIHRFGRISTTIAIVLMFMVPLGTMLYFGVEVNWQATFAAAAQLCVVFIPVQLTEVLSFTPLLGAGGTYLSFVTGNVMNMKLPAATSAQRLLNVDPASSEGEIVSILAIGMSSITTTLILFVGMLLLTPLQPILSAPFLKPGFDNIMPALMGTMLLPHLLKRPKVCIVPAIVATLAALFDGRYGFNQGYWMILTMAFAIGIAVLTTKTDDKSLKSK